MQENPTDKQFDFSEMHVFGKFDTFCKRLSKLIDLFTTMEKYKVLETLQIEGLDAIIKKFSIVVSQLQRKPYDILDHRKNVSSVTSILI